MPSNLILLKHRVPEDFDAEPAALVISMHLVYEESNWVTYCSMESWQKGRGKGAES